MRLASLTLCAAAACGFDAGGAATGDAAADDGEPPPIDATDAAPPPIDAIDATLPIDAAIDAGFDLAQCPSNYNLAIGGSRYRIRNPPGGYLEHYLACADDAAGFTHLVVLSDPAEAAALEASPSVCGANCDSFWTGLYAIDGTTFQTATTEPVWAAWDLGQPQDVDEPPVAASYNPTSHTHTDSSIDPGPLTVRSICECDGRGAETLPPF